MPNTKSAEARMRNSARKQSHNRTINTRLHSLEKKYLQLLVPAKGRSQASLPKRHFRLDKPPRRHVPKSRASRKKSAWPFSSTS